MQYCPLSWNEANVLVKIIQNRSCQYFCAYDMQKQQEIYVSPHKDVVLTNLGKSDSLPHKFEIGSKGLSYSDLIYLIILGDLICLHLSLYIKIRQISEWVIVDIDGIVCFTVISNTAKCRHIFAHKVIILCQISRLSGSTIYESIHFSRPALISCLVDLSRTKDFVK